MSKITKVPVPSRSLLAKEKSHYADAFSGLVHSDKKLTPVVIGQAFFRSSPAWISSLFRLRNRIAGTFGLKTGKVETDEATVIHQFQGNVGDRVGLFKIVAKSDDELVMGEQDKHLDFLVSLLIEDQNQLTISTAVIFHNWFGRLYFMVVGPFHKMIVPSMLKSVIRELERSDD